MDIVPFFGEILAEITGNKLIHCNGMIRLSFRDAGIDVATLKYEDIKKVIEKFLKERLDRIMINNSEKIVEKLITKFVENQSLFTMAA